MILAREYAQSNTHVGERLVLVTENRYLNDFSAFLCVGRFKNLGSLKFFLRYASNSLGPVFPKHRAPHPVFHTTFLSGFVSVSACCGWQSLSSWVVSNAPCSLFARGSVSFRNFLANNGRVDKLEYHHFFNLQWINGSRQWPSMVTHITQRDIQTLYVSWYTTSSMKCFQTNRLWI